MNLLGKTRAFACPEARVGAARGRAVIQFFPHEKSGKHLIARVKNGLHTPERPQMISLAMGILAGENEL